MTVMKVESDSPGTCVDTDDPAGEAPGVRDAVDDHGRSGDRAARPDLPQHAAAGGGDAVEPAVVRAEEHAPAPHRGGRVDVRAGADAPEIAAGGRGRRQGTAGGRRAEDPAMRAGGGAGAAARATALRAPRPR